MLSKIGKYEVLAEIGRGGFGRVYKALDASLPRTVAIKLFSAEADPGLLARFRSEAATTANLHHHNIVTVHEFGDHEGTPYIAMEYLQGQTFQDLIEGKTPLTLSEKLRMITQASAGFNYAHRQGIVHRDIKPANIMRLNDGTVKIMDFGIARVLGDHQSRFTQTGFLVGTLPYMAPEQFKAQEADALSEVFSFGIVFYELLTGQHPFPGSNQAAVMHQLLYAEPKSVEELVPQCPPGLARAMERILSKERDLRFQSLEDLDFEIRPILAELDRHEAATLSLEAEKAFAEGRVEDAKRTLRRVFEMDASNPTARQLRVRIDEENRQRNLRARFNTAIDAGKKALEKRKFPEAIRSFEEACQLDRADAQAQALLQEARQLKQNVEEALQLQYAAQRDLDENNLTSAFRHASDAVERDPDNREARDLLANINATRDQRTRNRAIQEALTQARSLVLSRDFDGALRTLAAVETEFGSSRRIDEFRTQVLEERKREQRRQEYDAGLKQARDWVGHQRFAEAENLLNDLAKRFPEDAAAGQSLQWARDHLRAEQKRDRIDRLAKQVYSFVASADFDLAEEVLQKTEHFYPGEPRLRDLGETIRKARSEAEKAKKLAAACHLVEGLLDAGKFEEALRAATATQRDLGPDARLTELEARASEELEQWRRNKQIKEAIATIQALADKRQFREAADKLQESIRQLGDDPQLTAQRGRLTTLESEWRKAEAIRKSMQEARNAFQQKRYADAEAHMESLLKQYPTASEARSLLAEIKAAGKAEVEAEAQRIEAQKAAARKREQDRLEGLFRDAEQHLAGERYDQARSLVQMVLSEKPGLARGQDLLARIHNAEREATIANMLRDAEEKMKAARYGEAREHLQTLIQQHPGSHAGTQAARALLDVVRAREAEELDRREAEELARCEEQERAKREAEEKAKREAEERARRDEQERAKREAQAKAQREAEEKAKRDSEERARREAEERSRIEAEKRAREEAERARAEEAARREEIENARRSASSLIESGNLTEASELLAALSKKFPQATEIQADLKKVRQGLERQRQRGAEFEKRVASCEDLIRRKRYQDALPLLTKIANDAKGETLQAVRTRAEELRISAQAALSQLEAEKAAKSSVRETVHEPPAVTLIKPAGKPLAWKPIAAAAGVVLVAAGLFFKFSQKPAVEAIQIPVRTDPPGASIQIGEQRCTTPACNIALPPGNYQVRAQLDGYEPIQVPLTVAPGAAAAPVSLTLQPMVQAPAANKGSGMGTLVVHTKIENALVFVDGKPRGRTDSQGNYSLPLEATAHQIRVEKADYEKPAAQSVTIAEGRSASLQFTLTQALATFTVRGAPSGIDIRINGDLIGRTDASGTYAHTIAPGDQVIQVTEGTSSRQINQHFNASERVTFEWANVAPPKAVATKAPDPAEQEWERVRNLTDPAQLQAYLDRFPSSAHSGEVQSLLDNAIWSRTSANDPGALRAYLTRFPRGLHARDASSRVAEIAWNALDKRDEQALQGFIAQNPNSSFRSEAQRLADQLKADAERNKEAQDKLLQSKRTQEKQEQEKQFAEKQAQSQAIALALNQFGLAFDRKQPNALRAIWPGATKQYLDAMVTPGATFVMKLIPNGEPIVTGDNASLTCTLVSTTTVGGRRPSENRKIVKVTLTKVGDRWLIDNPFATN